MTSPCRLLPMLALALLPLAGCSDTPSSANDARFAAAPTDDAASKPQLPARQSDAGDVAATSAAAGPSPSVKPADAEVVASRGDSQSSSPSPAAADTKTKIEVAAAPDTASPAAAQHDRVADRTFDDLKFDIEKDAPFHREMLPTRIEDMAGQRIRIRGYMKPTNYQTGLTHFVLLRDNQECCFGPGAALYDCILVHMSGDKTADYSVRPVAVEGEFSIDEFIGPDRKHLAIFRLDADSVE